MLSFILRETKPRVLVEAGLPAEGRAGSRKPGSPSGGGPLRARAVPERGAFPNAGTLLSTAKSVPNPPLGRGVPFFLHPNCDADRQ